MLSQFLNKQGQKLFFQPRMGVKDIDEMSQALKRLKKYKNALGTLTIDSFTRQYDLKNVEKTMLSRGTLNGFPLMYYSETELREKITALADENFLIQVRHGMSNPYKMFKKMVESGLSITEGGPISYCLPYSRTPLKDSFDAWAKSTKLLVEHKGHIESFAGCMMGQLSPPSLLIALNILEGLFFHNYHLKDISFSFAQGYDLKQDIAAVTALIKLIKKYFSNIDYHIVIYTFMGIYPQTKEGHLKLARDSCLLAIHSGAKRLIYKTHYEAFRIPTIDENINEIEHLDSICTKECKLTKYFDEAEAYRIMEEAETLIQLTLNEDDCLSEAIIKSFQKGILDVPYCLHPDNKNIVKSWVDKQGYVQWDHQLFPDQTETKQVLTSENFFKDLNFNRIKYDCREKYS